MMTSHSDRWHHRTDIITFKKVLSRFSFLFEFFLFNRLNVSFHVSAAAGQQPLLNLQYIYSTHIVFVLCEDSHIVEKVSDTQDEFAEAGQASALPHT